MSPVVRPLTILLFFFSHRWPNLITEITARRHTAGQRMFLEPCPPNHSPCTRLGQKQSTNFFYWQRIGRTLDSPNVKQSLKPIEINNANAANYNFSRVRVYDISTSPCQSFVNICKVRIIYQNQQLVPACRFKHRYSCITRYECTEGLFLRRLNTPSDQIKLFCKYLQNA